MALIPCRECEAQMSDAAPYCLRCGIRNPSDTKVGDQEATRLGAPWNRLIWAPFLGVLGVAAVAFIVLYVLFAVSNLLTMVS